MTPQISVLIPVYNAEKYLPQCLQSLAEQTYTDFEIIAVDDGSTDGSPEVLQSFAVRAPLGRGSLGELFRHAAVGRFVPDVGRCCASWKNRCVVNMLGLGLQCGRIVRCITHSNSAETTFAIQFEIPHTQTPIAGG